MLMMIILHAAQVKIWKCVFELYRESYKNSEIVYSKPIRVDFTS